MLLTVAVPLGGRRQEVLLDVERRVDGAGRGGLFSCRCRPSFVRAQPGLSESRWGTGVTEEWARCEGSEVESASSIFCISFSGRDALCKAARGSREHRSRPPQSLVFVAQRSSVHFTACRERNLEHIGIGFSVSSLCARRSGIWQRCAVLSSTSCRGFRDITPLRAPHPASHRPEWGPVKTDLHAAPGAVVDNDDQRRYIEKNNVLQAPVLARRSLRDDLMERFKSRELPDENVVVPLTSSLGDVRKCRLTWLS